MEKEMHIPTPNVETNGTVEAAAPADMLGDLQRLSAAVDATIAQVDGLAARSASPAADTDLLLATASAALKNSVRRPLGDVLGEPAAPTPPRGETTMTSPSHDGRKEAGSVDDLINGLWELTRVATSIRVKAGAPPQLLEATAALQDLACRASASADPALVIAKLDELAQMQAGLPCAIQASLNGPYLVTNVDRLTNWLGEVVPSRPTLALCRCGASANKPLCDGSHARVGFTSDKSPDRVPDRRDTYVGQQVTVYDNRGICQHSDLCTDRLAAAFQAGTEPFVTPSGGRMDEIVRAVRDCPSGALSFAIDATEAREQVDHANTRPATIEVTKDGPYRVIGGVELQSGE